MAEEDPDRRHCAELLKAFREARDLSRAEFGVRCGYSAATIKSFETGQRAIYAYHARHFDEAFELDGIFEHEVGRFGKAGYSADEQWKVLARTGARALTAVPTVETV
jgi:transcriptional regulator with XRE-family HTH domain